MTIVAFAATPAVPGAWAANVQWGKTYTGRWYTSLSPKWHGDVKFKVSKDGRTIVSLDFLTKQPAGRAIGGPSMPPPCPIDLSDVGGGPGMCPPTWAYYPYLPELPDQGSSSNGSLVGCLIPFDITSFHRTAIRNDGFTITLIIPWWPKKPPFAGSRPYDARVVVKAKFLPHGQASVHIDQIQTFDHRHDGHVTFTVTTK